MKQAITLFMIILFADFSQAQSNDYSNLWKDIEKLESKGLTQSAFKAVEAIGLKEIGRASCRERV